MNLGFTLRWAQEPCAVNGLPYLSHHSTLLYSNLFTACPVDLSVLAGTSKNSKCMGKIELWI